MWSFYGRIAPRAATWSVILATALSLVFGASCQKDVEEAEKFPTRDEAPPLEAGELTTIRLTNGITVYLQEEHSKPEIAVEVLYKVGVIDEGEGKTHVSRIIPHMLIFSPTASFKADGAVEAVQKFGRVNGEVGPGFTHFDYTVSAEKLDLVLQVEAERLTSVVFNEKQLKKYAKKCQEDIDSILDNPQLSLSKYGLMAFNQVYNYGKTSVPVYNGVYNITLDDLRRFHAEKYRLENMVIVVVGDFNTEETIASIKNHFENIEERPAVTPKSVTPITKDLDARWDIPASVILIAFPGPYENTTHQLALTMFGSLLNRQLMNNADIVEQARSTYCSSQALPVGDVPFFVFAEAKRGRRLEDIRPTLLMVIDETMRMVNEGMFGAMQTNITSFIESSIFQAQLNVANVTHYQVIGQEALNVGMKHYLREGRPVDEFIEMIRSMTYEEMGKYIESTLSLDNMITVTFVEQ